MKTVFCFASEAKGPNKLAGCNSLLANVASMVLRSLGGQIKNYHIPINLSYISRTVPQNQTSHGTYRIKSSWNEIVCSKKLPLTSALQAVKDKALKKTATSHNNKRFGTN